MDPSLENGLHDDFIAAESCSLLSTGSSIVLGQQANVWFIDAAWLILEELSYLLGGFETV